jgi:hypothetical protein
VRTPRSLWKATSPHITCSTHSISTNQNPPPSIRWWTATLAYSVTRGLTSERAWCLCVCIRLLYLVCVCVCVCMCMCVCACVLNVCVCVCTCSLSAQYCVYFAEVAWCTFVWAVWFAHFSSLCDAHAPQICTSSACVECLRAFRDKFRRHVGRPLCLEKDVQRAAFHAPFSRLCMKGFARMVRWFRLGQLCE